MPELSVIIPVYNAGSFLRNAVENILASEYKDIEIVLVDDGSTDGSGFVCDELSNSYSEVRVFHKNNGGISSARNLGIQRAKGNYIAFVDQDDTVSPKMYSELMSLAHNGYDIVLCDIKLVYPDRDEVYRTFEVHESHVDTYKDMLLHGYGCNIRNMVIRRSVVIDNNISFPEHLRHCEDVWFSLRLHLCVDKIAKIPEPLYIYNLSNPKQVSQNLDERFNQCYIQCYEETIPYFQDKGLFETYKKELYWKMLLAKTDWVFKPSKYNDFRIIHPEINFYIISSPLLSNRMKLVMMLIRYGLDGIAKIITKSYTKG